MARGTARDQGLGRDLAPKLALEVENNSAVTEIQGVIIPGMDYQLPYGQVAPAALDPPAGADVVEEWEWLYAIAKHMQLEPCITIRSPRAAIQGVADAVRLEPVGSRTRTPVRSGAKIPGSD